MSSNCCKWTGITCKSSSSSSGLENPNGGQTGRVVKLELGKKRLTGDFSESLGTLCQLTTLNLSHNLQGMLPLSLFHFAKFRGGLSKGIFRLQKLTLLELQENKFSGQLSKRIGKLTNLVNLDISSNGFTGIIPDVFHNCSKLQYFVAHSNSFTGSIPISLSNSPTLTLLNMRNNSLKGLVDLNCSAMSSLTSLNLGSNRFSGPIPDNLPSCKNLNNINLSWNNLGNQVPESFKNFHSLSYLSLSNSSINNLSSALRILQNCQSLTTLVLSVNFKNEELPADSALHFQKLKVFILAYCRLRGSIPKWLSHSNNLQLLDLSWNCLSRKIPMSVGNFAFLLYLDLSNNSLSGETPKSITGLRSLIDRNVSLAKKLPQYFPFFRKSNLYPSAFQYNELLGFRPTLDLSFNNLSRPIWQEFGNLRELHVLDLKVNKISGTIPSNLSGMNRDPSGGQFSTFPNSSFQGTNLCSDYASPCASNDQLHRERPLKPIA
ncbi:hypothetical protein FNV43_RR21659 [Rhamnella rubrinervis]|uniref:Uncharacterized protein n=1 Tax=Rhamnella rubrinervis TaxID=2594499 RepID=A0A8K0GQB9_9ROSA|nr:hypothetical protein FNV43_RR21659 [Rhamnella rubrinervis]